METEKLKKMLKPVCIICMVVYALFAVVGIMITASVIPPEAFADALGVASLLQGPNAATTSVIAVGIAVAAFYAIHFLFTIPMLCGAKDSSKMKLGIVLYGILIALTLASIVLTFMRGDSISTTSVQLLADTFILCDAVQIRRTEK